MSLQMSSTPPVWSRCQCVMMISWMLVLNCFSACLRLLMYSGTAGSPVSISTRLQKKHTKPQEAACESHKQQFLHCLNEHIALMYSISSAVVDVFGEITH